MNSDCGVINSDSAEVPDSGFEIDPRTESRPETDSSLPLRLRQRHAIQMTNDTRGNLDEF